MKGLHLTKRGELVRDAGTALLALPALYVFILSMSAMADVMPV